VRTVPANVFHGLVVDESAVRIVDGAISNTVSCEQNEIFEVEKKFTLGAGERLSHLMSFWKGDGGMRYKT
jgi:hypothetical protein